MKTVKKPVSKKPQATKSRVVWGIIDADGDLQIHSITPDIALARENYFGYLNNLPSYLRDFGRAEARKFFDLSGMKKLDVRKFRITTERLP